MNFRYDINGLRAYAVIAVVIFHFCPDVLEGGFAGVDVFFVISGYLMTSIIIRGFENNNFSLIKFYISRANRIIPALSFLCIAILIFGWFYLSPQDYKLLAKHSLSSIFFFSNFVFFNESGYFDTDSHEKWLLHSWSLSVEWQFYIIYPIILLIIKKYFSIHRLKQILLLATALLFILNIYLSSMWPDASYYLLPSRAWEMLIGGLAFAFPSTMPEKLKKTLEISGLTLVISSYFLVSSEYNWPGLYAFFPVFGSYLMIVANRQNSVITNNMLFQAIGRWSYSIYLWHWPVVLFGNYFEIENWPLFGIPLSLILGMLSYRLIENYRFSTNSIQIRLVQVQSLRLATAIFFISSLVYVFRGFEQRLPSDSAQVFAKVNSSPYRDKCHISKYQDPRNSCEYFSENVRWVAFGDSHTVEIAYALAEKLQKKDIGIKQLSFTGCIPSFGFDESFSNCSRWYNQAIENIISMDEIQYVVYIHRYSSALIDDNETPYPKIGHLVENHREILNSIDKTIRVLAKHKKIVYVFYPIPEIRKPIKSILSKSIAAGHGYQNIPGSSRMFHEEKNKAIIDFFEKQKYPPNVLFINPSNKFCNLLDCFATLNGTPLYFDNNHPSIEGAKILISDIRIDGIGQ